MQKFYIVYKTTNNFNSKFYIGMHSTFNIEDGYLGSGVILLKAIKKYGKESFTREIIASCVSSEVARDIERQLVQYHMTVDKRSCYNRAFGGCGACLGEDNGFYGKEHTEETRKKLSDKAKLRTGEKNHFYGKKHSAETIAKINAKRPNRDNSEGMRISFWIKTTQWYCTPIGCFYSSRSAAEFTGYGRNCIKSWCGQPDKMVSNNYQIPPEFWGRTWRENGFYIVSKTHNSN